MEKWFEDMEKRLYIIKRFLDNDLEVKNQYLLQLLEDLIQLLRILHKVIKQRESAGLSPSKGDSLEIIIEILNKKIKETDNIQKDKLIKQLEKIEAIYSIIKE